jgi:flagellar basal body P-ring protein FlgI
MPKVIIDSKKKTVIVNEKVRVQPLMFSHGNLRLSPLPEGTAAQIQQDREAVRTNRPQRSAFGFDAQGYRGQNGSELIKLQDIVDAFNRVGAKPEDIIDLIRAMKKGGMLKALVIEM